jgi:hypothetical protein
MYLINLKTLVVVALRQTFNANYPEPDFQNTYVSIEYPIEQQAYPSIWVDYDDTTTLRRAGVDHHEETIIPGNGAIGDQVQRYTRWEFGGTISLTVVALTSLERDRLYDEVIRVVAFGPQDPTTSVFRTVIENNDLLAANIDFDTIEARGNAAAPGTPWGTDEIIYERGINLNVIGEFLADAVTGDLVPLSAVQVTATEDPNLDPDAVYAPDPSGTWL